MSVEWRPPRVPNGIITRYTLYVGFEDGSVDVFYVYGESTSYNITNLRPYQIISVEISASTSVGEGPRSSSVEVQTAQDGKSVNIFETIIIIFSRTVPSEVNNLVVDAISNEIIDVLWDPPTHPNGILTYYTITVFNEMTGFNFSRTLPASDFTETTVTGLRKIHNIS